MPLSSGDRLGTYVIDSPLGAGGMGEVHKAHFSKLGRFVALKMLHGAMATATAFHELDDLRQTLEHALSEPGGITVRARALDVHRAPSSDGSGVAPRLRAVRRAPETEALI
jgi:hypothetical protein